MKLHRKVLRDPDGLAPLNLGNEYSFVHFNQLKQDDDVERALGELQPLDEREFVQH